MLRYLAAHPPAGATIEIPGLVGPGDYGQIFRERVLPHIHGASRVVALLDRPNANVAFEAGYALGRGVPTVFCYSGSSFPSWLQQSPFQGCTLSSTGDLANLEELVTANSSFIGTSPPELGRNVLLLCSRHGGDGLTCHEFVTRRYESWRTLPVGGWSFEDLPKHLRGIGAVVWVIASDASEAQGGDDVENAAAAAVAGYAAAVDGLDLRVLRSILHRPIVDTAVSERVFANLAELEKLLEELDPPADGPGPTDPIDVHRTPLRPIHGGGAPLPSRVADGPSGELEVPGTPTEEGEALPDLERTDCAARYAELVDKKYAGELTAEESGEMGRLREQLEQMEEEYFAPMLRKLRAQMEDERP